MRLLPGSRNIIIVAFLLPGMEKIEELITWPVLWRIFGMAMLVAVLYIAMDIWIGVLLAIIISAALDNSVSWMEKKKIPRVIGTLGIYIVLVVAIALLLYAIVPVALSELHILLKDANKFGTPALNFPEGAKIIAVINENISQIANVLFGGGVSFFDTISKFFGGVVLAISIFVLSFYLTVDRDGVEKFLKAILPVAYEDRVLGVYYNTRSKIGRWLYGQVLLSLSIGLAVFIGLSIIGVKYSLLLGILAGILEIVPFVGPIISGALAVMIAIGQSWAIVLYTFILFVIIQKSEGYFLVPMVMKFTTNLNPATILVALLVGGKILGVVGVVIAVPVAVAFQEIVDNWSMERAKRKGLGL